ncbi:MAG: hypothetical protein AB7V48_15835 [Sedimentibacter sp.]
MKIKLLIIAFILLLAGCSKPTESKVEELPAPSGEQTKIIEYIVKQSSEVTLEVADNGAEIKLPENTFDENVVVTVGQLTDYSSEGFELLGEPLQVAVDGKETVRLNQPVTVSFKISKEQLDLIKNEENIFAAYYNGSRWEYFHPDSIDLSNGIVQFTTYHFSSYAVGQLSHEEQLKYYAERMATNTWAKEDQEKNFVAKFEGYVNDIVADAIGTENKETTRKIMQTLVKEIPYMGGMLVSAANGDELEFAENFSSTLGKVILDQMELEGDLAGDLVTIASTYGKTAGDMSEDDYEEALKDITKGLATAIISKNAVGKMMVAATEVIDVAITDWKDKSIEDAYQAYKNGAEGEHGYDLDAGDYNELRIQMRGINHKIYSDAIKAYCKRNKISIDDLSKDEEERIKKGTDIKLKNEFDNRISKETEVDKQKEYHEKILKLFDERNLLIKGSFGYDVEMTLEDRIERLYLSMGKILSHTDKKFTTSTTAGEDEISIEDICKLLGIWYSDRTEGKLKYFEELKKMGHARTAKADEPKAIIEEVKPPGEEPMIAEPAKEPVKEREIAKGEYAWVLVEVVDGSNDDSWAAQNTSEVYQYALSYGRGSYSITTTYIGESDDYYAPPYVNGESLTITANWSTPPDVIGKDDVISLTGTIGVSANTQSAYQWSGSTGAWLDDSRLATKEGKTTFETNYGNNYASKSGTVTAMLGSGSEGAKKTIEIYFFSSNKLYTQYVYEWKMVN